MTRKAVESFTNPLRKVRGLQSPTDKLLHQTTISILVFLFLLLASKPFFGTPISCQVPKDWVGDEYFHDICYFGQREKSSHIKRINRGNKQGTMELNTLTGTSEFYMILQILQHLGVSPAPGRRVPYSNVYTTIVKCVLSSNFINAKAFLFLYCWFLFVSVVSSALHHTIILCVPTYGKYKISSMIRTEEYFIGRCGEPHHDLNLGEASPIEYFINYLGNDGYLIVQMVHDMMRHYSCDRFIDYVWEFVVVHNAQEIHFSKVPDKDVPHTKLSGAGDRYHGGKDLPKKKKKVFFID